MDSIGIATAGVIVAAVGVIVAIFGMIWHGQQTRRHNRLSVKPIVTHKKDLARDGESTFIGIKVLNVGIGPAIIKKVTMKIKGRTYPLSTTEEALAAMEAIGIKSSMVNYGHPDGDWTLTVGGEEWLFYIKRDGLIEDIWEYLNNVLSPVDVVVEYESIYGEKYA